MLWTQPSVCGNSSAARLCLPRSFCERFRDDGFLPFDQWNFHKNYGTGRFARFNAQDSAQFADTLAHSAQTNTHSRTAIAERSNLVEWNSFAKIPHAKRNRMGVVENIDFYLLALRMPMNVGQAFLKNTE